MTTRGSLTTARLNSRHSYNGFNAARPIVLGFAKLLGLGLSSVAASPIPATLGHGGIELPEDEDGTPKWILFLFSAFLVLAGGAFAGLTIALMGQDSIYLQVISSDKDEPQHKNAKRVYKLLESGKHWVLVTLLLANVVVNESLPVVLDRCLGGGVAAIVGSTALIVIFGEVVPQSVCVRYGLQIGGYMSKPVLALMYLTAPLSWPTAKLLDWILGEDHGTVYKKSGLKTLVTLHKSLGVASERLNKDEVTIISAVLDLKEKPVSSVMTPMDDVFVMSEDTVLDEPTMDKILSAGYSRIPIHESGNPTNFLGMLLVKILITYDPEDAMRVKDFPLATLPETRPETSCLDIVNYFQEGKSHMVLVSESPGNSDGALGVVTLEDVIEELIGEEIIDESDVYVDVHKAIRRLHPAPNAQIFRRHSVNTASKSQENVRVDANGKDSLAPTSTPEAANNVIADSRLSSSPKTTFLMRRSSAGQDGQMVSSAVPVRTNLDDIREHLKHLGPSNPANNPKNTRLTSVKIKPGSGSQGQALRSPLPDVPPGTVHETPDLLIRLSEPNDHDADEQTSLLSHTNMASKDGVQALRQSYGAASATDAQQRVLSSSAQQPTNLPDKSNKSDDNSQKPRERTQSGIYNRIGTIAETSPIRDPDTGASSPTSERSGPTTPLPKRSTVRSGSITENIFESERGFRKVVLETNSSNEDEDEIEENATHSAAEADSSPQGKGASSSTNEDGQENGSKAGKKKNKRKKKGKS
ncbi:hypothetical protein MGG_11236 [Pyricularia oryzae 70-15]|uniref:Uncharacterized protein n=1 Tax=Pyricularia oryzae (strain 70-15 / ATCC MYA-4617 / FGSC 8958) TaxID=242507 RepID=G4MYK0_PYRO7|nr:uncharacterized protein MGG_11236 [Pyricularia oryzae 70-15]EHA54425.1 hypothetical protein MGG_11236 [Pyricularia oryzae 70-15]